MGKVVPNLPDSPALPLIGGLSPLHIFPARHPLPFHAFPAPDLQRLQSSTPSCNDRMEPGGNEDSADFRFDVVHRVVYNRWSGHGPRSLGLLLFLSRVASGERRNRGRPSQQNPTSAGLVQDAAGARAE